MANIGLVVFFLWHIGSVIAWLGSTLTFTLGVSPSLSNMSGEVRTTVIRFFFPRFLRLLGGSSISAVVAGMILYGYLVSINSPYLPLGWRFIFIALGAVMGIVATILSLGVIIPMGNRLLKIASPDQSKPVEIRPDRTSLVKEEDILNVINSTVRSTATVLAIAFVLMVMAAYF